MYCWKDFLGDAIHLRCYGPIDGQNAFKVPLIIQLSVSKRKRNTQEDQANSEVTLVLGWSL